MNIAILGESLFSPLEKELEIFLNLNHIGGTIFCFSSTQQILSHLHKESLDLLCVDLDDPYIESFGHTILLYTPSETYTFRSSLQQIEHLLGSPLFLHCHQSYLLNMTYIQQIDETYHVFLLTNGTRIPIRTKEFDTIVKQYYDWCSRYPSP